MKCVSAGNVYSVDHQEICITELNDTTQHLEREKRRSMPESLFARKYFNATKAGDSNSSSKRISMKFTDKCMASLQSSSQCLTMSGSGNNSKDERISLKFSDKCLASLCSSDQNEKIVSLSAKTSKPSSNTNSNQLSTTAHKFCGPCVIKRVRLKNGKIMYVCDRMNSEKCDLHDATIDGVQNQMNDELTTEKHLLQNYSVKDSLPKFCKLECSGDENNAFEDDHKTTSVWMSGSGEPCFVTKLSPENNVHFLEDKTSLCANSDKLTIPTIIGCASISEEEFARSLNRNERTREVDQLSDVSH